jgi:hypothetical protein
MAVTVCSTAFETLGRRQAAALGCAGLPIALVPHPFGLRARAELPPLAGEVAAQIAQLVTAGDAPTAAAAPARCAAALSVPADMEALHRYCIEQHLSDGLPVIAPTAERVARMLAGTSLARDAVVAQVAPAYGEATVERIAANAVMAGCVPAHMNVLIAAVRAMAAPEFNLQGIQATTNPAAVWLVVNGPIAAALGLNGGANCLGQGAAGNIALGRALRLILQNVGGAHPGEMDRATHGQPGKIAMCCAENEAASPWPPLQVERGFAAGTGTVTVVGFSGTLNMNTHSKNADEILRTIADAMAHGPSNDYWCGGEPWIVISPEHAQILAQAGFDKATVKQRLWVQSRMAASRMADRDFERTRRTRREELGEITSDTLLPIAPAPARIGILVAGGEGTHSVYVPGFGNSHSVTRAVDAQGAAQP